MNSTSEMTDSEESDFSDDDYDEIYEAETEFNESTKTHQSYYLGLVYLSTDKQTLWLDLAISTKSFLTYDYSKVSEYLSGYSSWEVVLPREIEIIQLHINSIGEYNVIVKTYWLRIVQRRWKTVCRNRYNILIKRGSVQNQEYFLTCGRYLPGTRTIPGLRGMLSDI